MKRWFNLNCILTSSNILLIQADGGLKVKPSGRKNVTSYRDFLDSRI